MLRYLPAKISIAIIHFLVTAYLYVIRWLAVRENRRRGHSKVELREEYVVEDNHEFLDLTDRQNLQFRYSL